MPDSAVAITAGAGTSIDTFQLAGGDHQQVTREARATAEADGSWTVTTAGSASVIAADASRVLVMVVSAANGRVWLRWDATIPTATTYHWYLEPGDRFVVPVQLAALAVSLAGQVAGGSVLYHLATAS